MRPILVFFFLASLSMLCGTFWLGFSYHGKRASIEARDLRGEFVQPAERDALAIGPHIQLGWLTCLVVALTHSLVLVYHLGTGKALKNEIDEGRLDPGYHPRWKRIMARSILPACAGLVLVFLAFLSGGFVMIGKSFFGEAFPPSAHLVVALCAIFGQAAISLWQWTLILENGRLMQEVVDKLGLDGMGVAL